MRWTAPPERREIALVLFSLAAYFFAYNLETSIIDSGATRGILYRSIGLGRTRVIGADGRKPPGWRDRLETEIYGDWLWDEGHVVGHLRERSQPVVTSRHGASWLWRKNGAQESPQESHESVYNALQRWGNDIQETKVVKHAPGYTVIDNVYIVNGSVYLISDARDTFPPLETMALTFGNGFGAWKVLSTEEGRRVIGTYGSTIRGVSWMSTDSTPHNSTLFALWRTYSSLDPSIDSAGNTRLAPPHRLLFPHNRFFTDPNPDFSKYLIRRRRVDTGFHPYTAKAAFPQLTIQYYEDWEDYEKMALPFVFERLVVADRQSAQRSVRNSLPPFSSALALNASSHWWEPIRRNMARFLGVYEVSPKAKRVVTYLHSQSEPDGLKLSTKDHEALIKALRSMGRKRGFDVRVVSSQTSETDWTTRMSAIAKSSIVLGVYGVHMMESVFMQPSPQSMVMEFFSEEAYVRDHEVAAQSIGLQYMAWWGSRSLSSDFPPVLPPKNGLVKIDPEAVVETIVKTLSAS